MARKRLRFGQGFSGPAPASRPEVSKADFEIRRARAGDAPELARLRYEFRAELDPPVEPESQFVQRCTEWMKRQLLAGGTWRCWVADESGTIVGTVWLQLIEKLPNPVGHLGLHGYVSSIYVLPALRNAGIGSALMAACLDECRNQGVDAVFLWPTARSRTLYERHGFVVRDDLLERR